MSVTEAGCNSADHNISQTLRLSFMLLHKTAKALEELQPGSRQLPQRARSVLLMAGGKSLDDLQRMLGSDHAELARQLVEQGYLQLQTAPPVAPAALAPSAQVPIAPLKAAPEASPVASPHANDSEPARPSTSINMAGTRMYLFDMCERLFANRHEELAQQLRTQLREARDLTALREAGLVLLQAVEKHAGQDRAQSLRERLSALLAQQPSTEPAAVTENEMEASPA